MASEVSCWWLLCPCRQWVSREGCRRNEVPLLQQQTPVLVQPADLGMACAITNISSKRLPRRCAKTLYIFILSVSRQEKKMSVVFFGKPSQKAAPYKPEVYRSRRKKKKKKQRIDATLPVLRRLPIVVIKFPLKPSVYWHGNSNSKHILNTNLKLWSVSGVKKYWAETTCDFKGKWRYGSRYFWPTTDICSVLWMTRKEPIHNTRLRATGGVDMVTLEGHGTPLERKFEVLDIIGSNFSKRLRHSDSKIKP